MASVTFRYIQTGATVTFTQQVDIDSMKGHPEYERIVEEESTVKVTPEVEETPAKKPGRPKKVVTAVQEAE